MRFCFRGLGSADLLFSVMQRFQIDWPDTKPAFKDM